MQTAEKNKNKIRVLLQKLKNGGSVSLRDMKSALGESGVKEFESAWQSELEFRKAYRDKPDGIKKYESLLHDAAFYENRCSAITVIGPRSKKDGQGRNSKQRLLDKAMSKYQCALDYLESLLGADPGLADWFDRSVNFAPEGAPAPSAEEMPRVISAKSHFNTYGGLLLDKRSKAQIKEELLERALNTMDASSLGNAKPKVDMLAVLQKDRRL